MAPSSLQPTLILLHGATINGHMWDPIRRTLDSKYRVLTPDLPGHGSRRNEPFTLNAAVDTVLALAKSVAPAPIVVGGDSLGGYTTMASVAALPKDQVKGLILGGCTTNIEGTAALPYLFSSATFHVLTAVFGEERLLRTVSKRLIAGKLAPEDVDAMMRAGIHFKAFPQAVKQLRGVDFRTKLAAVEQPVLIINGEKDSGHMRHEPSFVAVAKDATVSHFPNCEHGVTVRRFAECAALINSFSERVFSSPS